MSIFDEVIDRSNTLSYKWNVKENELPMWVADMDFQTAPAISSVVRKLTYPVGKVAVMSPVCNLHKKKSGLRAPLGHAEKQDKKIIHISESSNAMKLSYTRSYSRYPQRKKDFAQICCTNKRTGVL